MARRSPPEDRTMMARTCWFGAGLPDALRITPVMTLPRNILTRTSGVRWPSTTLTATPGPRPACVDP
jgi:hypothetical protein